jgi:methionyl-tRNA synthetase
MAKFYLTAAIPYVNAKPHLGHALEFVQGDVIKRYQQSLGDDAFYITGADENSLKIVQAAEKEGLTPQQLSDKYSQAFLDLIKAYNISIDKFQRSSSAEHIKSAQELWGRCVAADDIYKKRYRGLYCVGCESFYTPEELNEKGECFEHPGKKVEEVEEENYFFRLSKYEKQIKEAIESEVFKVVPQSKKNEALGFIKQGLQDFSVSRSVSRAHGWGVPVPGDDSQIMYVWFDALNVYRSAAPDRWPADLHIIGKGIFRFHAVYWIGILLSAKLPLPRELFVHGYITVDGQKMSKSVGNVVDPMELVAKYGVDAIRYYLLREIPSDGDGDFSEEKFKVRYNADLANGIGNFAARVLTLAEKFGTLSFDFEKGLDVNIPKAVEVATAEVRSATLNIRLHDALASIWKLITTGDEYVNAKKPWELETGSQAQGEVLVGLLYILYTVSSLLVPFLPETVKKIQECIVVDKEKKEYRCVKPKENLFQRL